MDNDPDMAAEAAWRGTRPLFFAYLFFAVVLPAMAWWMTGRDPARPAQTPSQATFNLLMLILAGAVWAIGQFGLPFLRGRARSYQAIADQPLMVELAARGMQRAFFVAVSIFGFLTSIMNHSPVWAYGGAAIAIASLVAVAPRLENFREITRREAAGQDPWAKY